MRRKNSTLGIKMSQRCNSTNLSGKTFSESHVRELFGGKQNGLVAVESDSEIRALNSENASGPCRDRTDDPQIKSLLLYRLS